MSAWKEAEMYTKLSRMAREQGKAEKAKEYEQMAEQAEREYRDECRREDAED